MVPLIPCGGASWQSPRRNETILSPWQSKDPCSVSQMSQFERCFTKVLLPANPPQTLPIDVWSWRKIAHAGWILVLTLLGHNGTSGLAHQT
jgi:hypothetical protein